jgi:hypothetical protein
VAEICNRKTPEKSAVELAIAALDGNANPLDMDFSGVDLDRTSLDLPEAEHQEMCSLCGGLALHRCTQCGSPLCDDCVGLPDQD